MTIVLKDAVEEGVEYHHKEQLEEVGFEPT